MRVSTTIAYGLLLLAFVLWLFCPLPRFEHPLPEQSARHELAGVRERIERAAETSHSGAEFRAKLCALLHCAGDETPLTPIPEPDPQAREDPW